MGRMNYKEMKELLLTTLDTMDRYNRIIRQLLEDDDNNNKPTSEDTNEAEEPIIEDSEVDLNIIEEVTEVISDIMDSVQEEPIIEIITVEEQKENEPDQLEISSVVESKETVNPVTDEWKPLKRVPFVQKKMMATDFIMNYIKTNDPELKSKPKIGPLYSAFTRWSHERNVFAIDGDNFGKIVEDIYKSNKPNPVTLPITKGKNIEEKRGEVYTKSGIHEYSINPENLKSIKPQLRVGDVVGLKHERYGEIAFDVIGINIDAPDTVSLLSSDVVDKKWFDPRKLVYDDSSVRYWLNNKFAIGLEIADLIIPVEKKTISDYGHMRLVKSTDYCWLPSRDELLLEEMKSAEIYENNRYPFFKEARDRIKRYKGQPINYLTRTAYKCDPNTDTYKKLYSKSNYMFKVDKEGQIRCCSGSRNQGIAVGLCI